MLRIFDRIFDNLVYRKLYHLLGGGIFVLGIALLDKEWFLAFDTIFILLFKVYGKRISFAAIGMLLLYLLSGSRFITMYSTVIWLVGDGMAALIGAAYGKTNWPWSNHKTLLGSYAFLLSSVFAALPLATTFIETSKEYIFLWVLIPCLWGSLVEAMPLSIFKDRKADDNLLVIVSTGLLLVGLSFVLKSDFRF